MSKSTNNQKFNTLHEWMIQIGVMIKDPIKGYIRAKKEIKELLIKELED